MSKEKEDLGAFLEKTRKVSVRLTNRLRRFKELLEDPEEKRKLEELISKSLKTTWGIDEKPIDRAIKESLPKLSRSMTMLGITLMELKKILEDLKD